MRSLSSDKKLLYTYLKGLYEHLGEKRDQEEQGQETYFIEEDLLMELEEQDQVQDGQAVHAQDPVEGQEERSDNLGKKLAVRNSYWPDFSIEIGEARREVHRITMRVRAQEGL